MRAVAAALLAATTLISGCGGGDDDESLASCQAEARNAAQAAVLADAFERGRLGTQDEVQANFTPEDRIFDEQGQMLPYSELEGLTRGRFDEWRASSKIPGDVQHDLAVARDVVRRTGHPGC